MSKKLASLENFFGGAENRTHKDNAVKATAKKRKVTFNRKYDESYLKYGFIPTGDQHAPIPMCVICGDKLDNESMKPSKLLRQLETKHPNLKDKPIEYFERKLQQQAGQQQALKTASCVIVAALRASYLVADRIGKAKKPFTIKEELILPAAKICAVKCLARLLLTK